LIVSEPRRERGFGVSGVVYGPGMSDGFPHVHLGPHAVTEPDPEPRSYRLTVLIERVSEADVVEIAGEVADALAARGIAIRDADETVRSVIGVDGLEWPENLGAALEGVLAGALHVVVPKAVPQPPNLAVDYSPN
jgi:hypothetical protein